MRGTRPYPFSCSPLVSSSLLLSLCNLYQISLHFSWIIILFFGGCFLNSQNSQLNIWKKKRNNEKGSSWVRCCVDLVWLVIQRLNLKLIFVLEEKLGINYHEFMLFWIEISVWVLIKFTLCNEVGHWKNFVGIVVRLIT